MKNTLYKIADSETANIIKSTFNAISYGVLEQSYKKEPELIIMEMDNFIHFYERELGFVLRTYTVRQCINWIFNASTRLEDGTLAHNILEKFSETIGMTYEDAHAIYIDVESKGH